MAGSSNRDDWQRLSESWQGALDERIRHLQQLCDEFTDCIGWGCLSLDRCAIINADDELGAQGPGPRRLLGPGRPSPAAGP
jgi:MerR family redox-sensitive transcriptional activator SoxR